ncbi:alkaline phosphatase D [Nocardioides thalensis]|uniref:Alkaline phosphatase D n=1 Tax=Nocardioides thalensis TaxID=1914755 RepID=A0A853C157_9ACTN|nr:alkaline phosphatase D family protein [Nocardioides thalensis]NYJ00093.1 alkaline phosphatase D [Nocardioides thalensis]
MSASPTRSAGPAAKAAIGRRGFVGGAGAAAVLLGTGAIPGEAAAVRSAAARTAARDYPFTLGVASGDPLPNSVVLWTRLATDPLAADGSGGMPPRPVGVAYEVAEDERFRRVVKRGAVTATPALGHSVHPEVWGLRPSTVYYFRFRVGGHISPVGRTRTAPSLDARNAAVSFAFASCARWDQGFYTAYGHLANEDLDLVVHLGDYLYEYGINATGGARNQPMGPEFAGETTDLARYRLQYGLYKSDPNLMAAHASAPFVVTPDDHEVENNWADEIPEASSQSQGELWMPRRTAAFQAYYENLPFRAGSVPSGADMQIYRKLSYGTLLDFNVLDTRQYRDDQPYGDGSDVPGPESTDPSKSMMGLAQEKWLLDNFARSRARWQVLANQAPMAETDQDATDGKLLFMDPWDGYVANRERILGGARDRGVDNLVVITGDRHQNYASNLLLDYDDPSSPVVGSEFVGTSITSGGDGADMTPGGENLLAANPHLKFFNSQRGYVRCKVTREEWRSDYRVIPYVTRPDAPVSTRATWVVENGVPGVQLASEGAVVGRRRSATEKSEAELDVRRARAGR